MAPKFTIASVKVQSNLFDAFRWNELLCFALMKDNRALVDK